MPVQRNVLQQIEVTFQSRINFLDKNGKIIILLMKLFEWFFSLDFSLHVISLVDELRYGKAKIHPSFDRTNLISK